MVLHPADFQPQPIYSGADSTLLSWNGTCPESPDGSRIIYTRQAHLSPSLYVNGKTVEAELHVCNADLSEHRKLFVFQNSNHNGSMASWIDNSRVVLRTERPADEDLSLKILQTGRVRVDASQRNMLSDIHVLNVDSGEVEYGPIVGSVGHRPARGKVYFSVNPPQLESNDEYDEISECGIYELDCKTGLLRAVLTFSRLESLCRKRGFSEPQPYLAHVNPNDSGTRLMFRCDMKKAAQPYQTIISVDMEGQNEKFLNIEPRPFHQLWYDDENYCAASRKDQHHVYRYTQDGERLEKLSGAANHFHLSPDGKWLVSDSKDRMMPWEIYLYRRGETEPTAVIDRCESPALVYPIWSLKAHSNPVFSRDGKSIYYLRSVDAQIEKVPVEPAKLFKTEAARVDISNVVG